MTLASAAEGILPDTNDPHLRKELKHYISEKELKDEVDLNLGANWLKHGQEYKNVILTEFETAIMILRAISKFVAVYHQSNAKMEEFREWARAKGHFSNANA
jgi:hypothetical protein